jgi:hypothetical protein
MALIAGLTLLSHVALIAGFSVQALLTRNKQTMIRPLHRRCRRARARRDGPPPRSRIRSTAILRHARRAVSLYVNVPASRTAPAG